MLNHAGYSHQQRQTTGTAVQWTPSEKELPTYQRWFASLQSTSINGDPERLDGAAVAAFLRKSGLESSKLKQIWFEATNRSRERTISRDNFYVACRLVAQVQNNGQPLRTHMGRSDALGLPDFTKPVTRVRRDSYILSPPPSATAALSHSGHAESTTPSSLALPPPPPSRRRRASMPETTKPGTPNRSQKPALRRASAQPLSASKSSPAHVATPLTSPPHSPAPPPPPLASAVPIPTSATATQIPMTAAVPITATEEVTGPVAHAVPIDGDTISSAPPPNLKAGAVDSMPKKAQRWTNPWEPSSGSPFEGTPNEVASKNSAGQPGWTNPWECYDDDTMSPMSPPHSTRPTEEDNKNAKNWTNPWESDGDDTSNTPSEEVIKVHSVSQDLFTPRSPQISSPQAVSQSAGASSDTPAPSEPVASETTATAAQATSDPFASSDSEAISDPFVSNDSGSEQEPPESPAEPDPSVTGAANTNRKTTVETRPYGSYTIRPDPFSVRTTLFASMFKKASGSSYLSKPKSIEETFDELKARLTSSSHTIEPDPYSVKTDIFAETFKEASQLSPARPQPKVPESAAAAAKPSNSKPSRPRQKSASRPQPTPPPVATKTTPSISSSPSTRPQPTPPSKKKPAPSANDKKRRVLLTCPTSELRLRLEDGQLVELRPYQVIAMNQFRWAGGVNNFMIFFEEDKKGQLRLLYRTSNCQSSLEIISTGLLPQSNSGAGLARNGMPARMSAKSTGSAASASASPGAASASASADATGFQKCYRCTFVQTIKGRVKCQSCGAPLRGSEQRERTYPCSRCTFENPFGTVKCNMCNNHLPTRWRWLTGKIGKPKSPDLLRLDVLLWTCDRKANDVSGSGKFTAVLEISNEARVWELRQAAAVKLSGLLSEKLFKIESEAARELGQGPPNPKNVTISIDDIILEDFMGKIVQWASDNHPLLLQEGSDKGLSRVQLSRVVACCDVLFFEQNRFGSKLRPPFQASNIKKSKSMPGKSASSLASAEKKKKKKKNLFHFIKKKVLRRKKSIDGSVNPLDIEDGNNNTGAAAAAAAAKPNVPVSPEQLASYLICPLTKERLTDPVLTVYGDTYDRKALSAHLATHGTDPVSKKPLTTDQVIPNKLVREGIEFYDSGAKAPSDEVPEFLLDPISYEAVEDPLTTKYGNTFSRAFITDYADGNGEDPINRAPLTKSDLYPNKLASRLVAYHTSLLQT